jgi:hypothetical protein
VALTLLCTGMIACGDADDDGGGATASGGDTDGSGTSSPGTASAGTSASATNGGTTGGGSTSGTTAGVTSDDPSGGSGSETTSTTGASSGTDGTTATTDATDTDPGTTGTTDASGTTAGTDTGSGTDTSTTGEPAGPTCSATLDPAVNGTFVELCAVEGKVGHVRLTNLVVPPMHASTQVLLGLDAAPTGPQAALDPGEFKLLFYGGSGVAPPPAIQAVFGATTVTLPLDGGFLAAPSTVCFDVHDGAADLTPAVVLWVDGLGGADCEDPATLTVATAAAVVQDFGAELGAIADGATYARQSAAPGSLEIELRNAPVTLREELASAPSTTCELAGPTTTDWTALCVPEAGPARHVRVEGAAAPAPNRYWYIALGEDEQPAGNPGTQAGDGTFVLTGGQSNSGASWTWLRFNGGSTTQYGFATESGDPLYTAGPSTVCFDAVEGAGGNLRIRLWATGALGADCADFATLGPANVLYDSETDMDTGAIWNAPLRSDGFGFVKLSSTDATIGRVVVSSEPAIR